MLVSDIAGYADFIRFRSGIGAGSRNSAAMSILKATDQTIAFGAQHQFLPSQDARYRRGKAKERAAETPGL